MAIDVDAINMDIRITEKDHLTFNGHYINIDENDGLIVWCRACNKSASFNTAPDGLHKWESVLYLLNDFDGSCEGDAKDLEEQVQDVMQKYVGKPADQGRLASMEHDIREVVGDDVPINIST